VILFFKGHIEGYTKKDGTFVRPHFRRADQFAERAHAGQYRSGKPGAPKTPYISHPRAVAAILQDEAGITDEAMLIAALLHDTVEDCGITHAHLVAEFGHDVADLVAELTNDPTVSRDGKLAMQVAKARKMSARAAAVKIGDKIANLRNILSAPPDWTAERQRRYFDDARKVVHAMSHRHPVLDAIFEQIYNTGIAKT
jgi:guanosine-3',5'-bis(diphosphate) 3'-pyrophosphohydrolase